MTTSPEWIAAVNMFSNGTIREADSDEAPEMDGGETEIFTSFLDDEEAVERLEYLFLVPYNGQFGGWQIATRDDKVITTLDPQNHFGGNMPVIVAGRHFMENVGHEDLMHGVPSTLDNDGQ